jgi:hypothetical protein
VLIAREDLAEGLEAAGLGPDGDPRLEPSELVGKRPLEALRLDGEDLVVRRYHHGGLLRWLTGERFADPERPFVELCLQRELERAGFRTPEVVAARAVRAAPWGWKLAVVTRRVPDALDLGQALAMRRGGQLSTAGWRVLVGEVGRLVAGLHASGFLHADLTPRNVLVERGSLDAGPPRLWVLDLDGSRWVEGLGERDRRENLRRLARHVERLGRERGLRVERTDLTRFLRAWQPELPARHAACREIAARSRSRSGLHRGGWWIERWLGRGRSGAEGHLGRGPSSGT